MEFNLIEILQLLIEYIDPKYLILIPALATLGAIIKHSKLCVDEYIPIILMTIGIFLALALGQKTNEYIIDSIIQGIISCAVAVWGHQATKQLLTRWSKDVLKQQH